MPAVGRLWPSDDDDPVDNHADDHGDIESNEDEDNQITIKGSVEEEEEANSGSGFSSSVATRIQETSRVLQVRCEGVFVA